MTETRHNTIRATHPRWHIEQMVEVTGGWQLGMFDKEKEKEFELKVNFNDFVDWLAEQLFTGMLNSRVLAEKYIYSEPEWAKKYLTEYIFAKL